jgi:hypothetical protein
MSKLKSRSDVKANEVLGEALFAAEGGHPASDGALWGSQSSLAVGWGEAAVERLFPEGCSCELVVDGTRLRCADQAPIQHWCAFCLSDC